MEHPDYKYINALISHDNQMIKEIEQKCFGDIKRMVCQNNGTEADARDVFQEAIVALLVKAKAQKIILTNSICALIYFICRNKWINELKRKRKYARTFSDAVNHDYTENTVKTVEDISLTEQRIKFIEEKISKLSQSCQKVIRLSGENSMKEVATILNQTHGGVRVAKCKCMKELIEHIEKDPHYKHLNW